MSFMETKEKNRGGGYRSDSRLRYNVKGFK